VREQPQEDPRPRRMGFQIPDQLRLSKPALEDAWVGCQPQADQTQTVPAQWESKPETEATRAGLGTSGPLTFNQGVDRSRELLLRKGEELARRLEEVTARETACTAWERRLAAKDQLLQEMIEADVRDGRTVDLDVCTCPDRAILAEWEAALLKREEALKLRSTVVYAEARRARRLYRVSRGIFLAFGLRALTIGVSFFLGALCLLWAVESWPR
jgi:hypothetical protein